MKYQSYIISPSFSGRDALQRLNDVSSSEILQAVLFVVDQSDKLIGSVTDGDIRRGLINGLKIEASITEFMRTTYRFLNKDTYTSESIISLKKQNIRLVPFLNEHRNILRIVDVEELKAYLPLDVVIMAGGRGERLKPLTDDCPKPLLKVGSKPIIEHNIDRLMAYGIVNFNITVKYLGDKIKEYCGDGSRKQVKINYIDEDIPLGTIGSLSLINNWNHEYVLVMNSDLLTNIDMKDFFDFFVENSADMAVASIPYYVKVPYAVFEFSDGRQISSLKEKPSYTYYSNAGIYLIKRELINLIPKGKKFDATDFMDSLILEKKKIVSYPITSYWLDIGRMEDYTKAQEDIKHIKL